MDFGAEIRAASVFMPPCAMRIWASSKKMARYVQVGPENINDEFRPAKNVLKSQWVSLFVFCANSRS